MIIYKYNLWVDIRWALRTIIKYSWLKKQGLKVFLPNIFNTINLIIHKPKNISIVTDKDVICYWISSGTWGAYTPPNKIFICPLNIERAGGLKKVIEHELTHLKYEDEVCLNKMTHKQKEDFINKKSI